MESHDGRAVAPGKRTLVGAATGFAGPAPPTPEADRHELVDRGAGADPNRTGPQPFPAPGGSTGQQRHDAADARFQLIEQSVAGEDVADNPRTQVEERTHVVAKNNKTKGMHTVADQLAATGTRKAALDAKKASTDALAAKSSNIATAVAAFEAAVRAYQDAYERTYLVSTDAAVTTDPWCPETWRERMSDKEAAKKALKRWVDDEHHEYIKFVVPVSKPGEVYIGSPDHGHIDIANENALTAGIMKVDTRTMKVSGLENASGGYRPGPLRNALALARMIDLGFVEADLAGTEVHHRPDGSYTGSRIRR